MSTIQNQAVVVSTTTTVTPNPYFEMAQARIAAVRSWRQEIPRFTVPEDADATRRLASAASVSPEFLELSNVAVSTEPPLVRGEAPTPAEVRDLVAFADALDPLADELEAMAQFIRHSTTAARNQAGTESLITYELIKRLAKLPKYAHLRPLAADMRRALGKMKKLTEGEAAKKAADRAAKAAAKVARKAALLQPLAKELAKPVTPLPG